MQLVLVLLQLALFRDVFGSQWQLSQRFSVQFIFLQSQH
jgi:hypothetical protein